MNQVLLIQKRKKQKKIDAHDDIVKKYYVIELFVIILFVLSYIMYGPQSDWLKEYITWKLVWQILFILTIISSISY